MDPEIRSWVVWDRADSPIGAELELAWNPEFIREGLAIEDTLHPDRLVFGVASEWAERQLAAAFAPILDQETPLVVTDLAPRRNRSRWGWRWAIPA